MKTKFKQSTITIVLLLCAAILSCLGGCTNKYTENLNRVFETEYFLCISYDDVHVTILALTEQGQKQTDYLIIPKEINGMEVTALGGEIEGGLAINRKQYWFSSSAKKVFLEGKDYILRICRFAPETVIISQYYDSDCIKLLAEEKYSICSVYNNGFDNFYQANIYYFNNYKGDDDLYCLDWKDENTTWSFPPIPVREGYTFTGWYAEPECLNKIELNGYAKTDEEIVYLYAGWEEGS